MNTRLFALLAALTLAAGSDLPAAPNDQFANRFVLAGTNVTASGSNTNASKEPGEPDHANNEGGKSVWWAWTPPANADVTIHTEGSAFDTLLAVYTGSSVSNLNLIANNDDHGITNTSRVRFQAAAGVQYQIAIDGFNGGTGASTGNVALKLVAFLEPLPRPPNDHFANRITLGGYPVTVNSSNFFATREPGEPLHALAMSDASVWWRWTSPVTELIKITTAGSSFDTLLGVYTGTSVSNLVEVATNDDEAFPNTRTSAVIVSATQGETYQIAVDGFDGAWGQIVLNIRSERPLLTAPVRLPNGSFRFVLDGIPARTNEIQASTNLMIWEVINTVVNTNGTTVIVDPDASVRNPRFYRVRQVP